MPFEFISCFPLFIRNTHSAIVGIPKIASICKKLKHNRIFIGTLNERTEYNCIASRNQVENYNNNNITMAFDPCYTISVSLLFIQNPYKMEMNCVSNCLH